MRNTHITYSAAEVDSECKHNRLKILLVGLKKILRAEKTEENLKKGHGGGILVIVC